MKKALLFLLSVITLQNRAQSSILVTNMNASATVAPNGTIYTTSFVNGSRQLIFDITNLSASQKSYQVKRYDISLHTSATETASAYFAFAGADYQPTTFVSQSALTLNASQSASSLGGYQALLTYFDEISSLGISKVKYTFFNTAAISDSVQFSVFYNVSDPTTGVRTISRDFRNVEILPNPSAGLTQLLLTSSVSTNGRLVVFNALGDIVSDKKITLNEGKNAINLGTEDLSNGIYFVSLSSGNITTTRKLVLNKN